MQDGPVAEAEKHSGKALRFPYFAALVCAAGVWTAAWLWLRYSYCWDTTPIAFEAIDEDGARRGLWKDRYVEVVGDGAFGKPESLCVLELRSVRHEDGSSSPKVSTTYVRCAPGSQVGEDVPAAWRGRVAHQPTSRFYDHLYVDACASRWTGQSVAGLVVGAMGCFVFAVTLRHWLRERGRISREGRGT